MNDELTKLQSSTKYKIENIRHFGLENQLSLT